MEDRVRECLLRLDELCLDESTDLVELKKRKMVTEM